MTTIGPNSVVTIHYVLTDDQGVPHEDTRTTGPVTYLHGTKVLVSGLEKALSDKRVGDELDVHLNPAQAFGLKQRYRLKSLPRVMFTDDIPLDIGTPYLVDEGNGEQRIYWIASTNEETISLQQNHPLAGRPVHFWVQICDIREPTEDELRDGCAHATT
jgi:FKBP-type peptidyl-prolyl cis-trans isomerase SlyD